VINAVDPWPTADLEARLCRALDLAARVVTEFGSTGYTDPKNAALSFGPEKVVAEAAMLAYCSFQASSAPEVMDRVAEVARRLAPLVRSQRVLIDMALRPGRAFKHAVPHVLLTVLGYLDEVFDEIFRSRCALTVEFAGDPPPSVLLERYWIVDRWALEWRPHTDHRVEGIFIERPIDVLSDSREEAYSLTHLLFYLTDFGREPPPLLSRTEETILHEVEGLLLRYLDLEDYDLVGELLMAWPQLRAPWSPTAAFAFRVIARVEDEVGVLPCGNIDLGYLNTLDEAGRSRYAQANAYHTAFVMGFLCAVSLRNGMSPPILIPGTPGQGAKGDRLLPFIDSGQGHWVKDLIACSDTERQILAPMLCNIAIHQKLRLSDFAGLRDVLVLADDLQLPSHPLRTRAIDVLSALGTAMNLFDIR
jgi:hypothetical protein